MANRSRLLLTGIFAFSLAFGTRTLMADAPSADQREAKQARDGTTGWLPNIKVRTLGGLQFWGDEQLYFDWRIQRNVLTGHCRLLDGGDRRHAWGTFCDCRDKLDEIRRERNLPEMEGAAVVVLHGLFRTRHSMEPLCRYLREQGELVVLNVGYPTTRASVADHAERLSRILSRLEKIDEVSFVCHSMGNIVLRHYLADRRRAGADAPPGPEIRRIVMLGPPNHGAELARKLVPLDFSGQILAAAPRELGAGWKALEPKLATPECEFGILAGGSKHGQGRNPLIPGDDDLVVSVESTRLSGARDFRQLPLWHTTMMKDQQVQRYVLQFLKHGYFESEEKRSPLP